MSLNLQLLQACKADTCCRSYVESMKDCSFCSLNSYQLTNFITLYYQKLVWDCYLIVLPYNIVYSSVYIYVKLSGMCL